MDIPDFFGLDISSSNMRLAQVRRNGNSADLTNISMVNITENIIEDGSEATIKSLAEKIKALRKQSGTGTNNCVIGLPEAPIFSRLLTLPKVDDADMDETVNWELKPLIPVSIADVDIAYLEVDEKIVNDQKQVDIFTVAAPKALTNRFKQLAELSGLNLLALETKALAAARAVSFNYADEAKDSMIFYFNETTTDLVLSRQGIPVFTQSISTGAGALSKAIAADFGIDELQATQYRDAFGLDKEKGEGKIARALDPIMQILVNEVSRTLTYFREKLGDTGVTRIFIAGEASHLPGLDKFLSQAVNIDTSIVDPLDHMKAAPNLRQQLQDWHPSSFAVAIGLALKDR
jgi:type IV pilus assembly protein PilM